MIKKLLPASCLAISGLLITLVSAFLSIKGFLLFLPDPELYLGLFGLGVAFELAKITVSTFLFHRMKDKTFPMAFKFLMFASVLSLVIFSSIFSFVHLNASSSASFSANSVNDAKVERLLSRNKDIRESIEGIETQLNNIPSNVVTARMKLYDKLKPEKDKLDQELRSNLSEIDTIKNSNLSNDQFKFLSSLSEISGYSKEKIFTIVVLFIVIIIDPLAISLFLSASHIWSGHKEEEKEVEEDLLLEEEIPVVDSSPILSIPNVEQTKELTVEELKKEIDTDNDGIVSKEEIQEFTTNHLVEVDSIAAPLEQDEVINDVLSEKVGKVTTVKVVTLKKSQ